MQDTNALFDSLLAAYRNADDPDRFLREFLMRLDDATSNAVVAAERKLDRLDAARARLEAARAIPRPDTTEDGAGYVEDEQEQDAEDAEGDREQADDDRQQDDPQGAEEEADAPPAPKRRKAKSPASVSDGRQRRRAPAR